MFVDDEEFCLSAMKQMISIFGINTSNHIDYCINGKEAVEKFIESSTYGITYSVIFTDFSMPVMDGIQSTILIRKYIQENLQYE